MKNSHEQPHSPEHFNILRNQAIEARRTYLETGMEEDEKKAKEYFAQWIEQEEEKRDSGEQDEFGLCLNYAEFYEEAGMTENAIENLEQAALIAWQVGKDEIYDEIQDRIQELKKTS